MLRVSDAGFGAGPGLVSRRGTVRNVVSQDIAIQYTRASSKCAALKIVSPRYRAVAQ